MRATEPAEISTPTKIDSTIPEVIDHLAHHEKRILIGGILDAWAGHWERRARTFEAARPTAEEAARRPELADAMREQWARLTEIAQACRARARVSPLELVEDDVDNVLGEVAS